MLLWDLIKPLVTWSVPERERRLFHVCVQVQATLMARHPGYQTPSVHTVPDAVVDEVEEMLREILSSSEAGPQSTAAAERAPEEDPHSS